MRREPPPILRKQTSDIIAESRADLDRASANQAALYDLISGAREKINDSKDLLRRIEAVLKGADGKR